MGLEISWEGGSERELVINQNTSGVAVSLACYDALITAFYTAPAQPPVDWSFHSYSPSVLSQDIPSLLKHTTNQKEVAARHFTCFGLHLAHHRSYF